MSRPGRLPHQTFSDDEVYGLEVLTNHQDPSRRVFVELLSDQACPYAFETEAAAERYAAALRLAMPHVTIRVDGPRRIFAGE